jgi:hypothetical protein
VTAAPLPGQRVLIVDDLIATGGTVIAAAALIHSLGAVVAGVGLLVGIDGLKGWRNFHNPVAFFERLAGEEEKTSAEENNQTNSKSKNNWRAQAERLKKMELTSAVKDCPVFTMVDALRTPSMPDNGTESYLVSAESSEFRDGENCIAKALEKKKANEVLVREGDKFSFAMPGADGKYNQAYLMSEA